jgi:acetyl-CoA C-acetyltransferase
MSEIHEVVVLSGARTAVGTYGGSLKDLPPTELAARVVREAVRRSGLAAEAIQHSVFGNVIHTDARDPYLARVAAIEGGLPITTPAYTLNRLCGSGLQAIVSAAQMIRLGDVETAVAGGAESMSRAPYWTSSQRWGQRLGHAQLTDAMVAVLHDPFHACHMGITAENLADKYRITRADQDQLALESHQRAARAIANGYFKEQILPIEIKSRKSAVVFDMDEHVRKDVNPADLSKLKPAFKDDGTVTPGNASGLNDGAAAVILASAGYARHNKLKPMARLVGYGLAAVDPQIMGIGPVPAVRNVLQKTGLKLEDLSVIELNEAFAAQALAVMRELGLPADRTNPNGSGIALGHPIGATGCIITIKALYELQRIQGKYALVTMCIGGGQGIAAIFENMS